MARLRILATGSRMPDWVEAAYTDYSKRLPRDFAVELREFALSRQRSGSAVARAIDDEGAALLGAVAADEVVVALEVGGKPWSSDELATRLREWRDGGRRVSFLIGGPDGLSAACRARADAQWSLSRLTLPHALARIVVIEQLYRAYSIIAAHPYHR